MKSAVWSLLLCTAVLACAAGTACAQQKATGGSSALKKGLGDARKVAINKLSHRDGEDKAEIKLIDDLATESLLGAIVSGTYLVEGLNIATGNLFDRDNTGAQISIPDYALNFNPAYGFSNVPISDGKIEFATQWENRSDFSLETIDITSGGEITLTVNYESFPAYFGGEYTLVSEKFKAFDEIKIIKNTLPDDCEVHISGADDLREEGKLQITIPHFTAHPLKDNKVEFELKFKLIAALECEHGYDTPCCTKYGKLRQAGEVCWRDGVCSGAVCDGFNATCPEDTDILANGTKCDYDPLYDTFLDKFGSFIHPKESDYAYAAANNKKAKTQSYYKHGKPEYVHHPACKGECQAGKCTFDRREDGCCTLTRRKQHDKYPTYAKTAGTGMGRSKSEAQDQVLKATKGGVWCWEGTEEDSTKAQ